jgi:nucleoside-diphosphate-sugar epimerase
MRVILTGGTGFIGHPVLKKLIELNYEVLLVGRNISFANNLKIKKIRLDLNNFTNERKKIIDFKPEAILHLAWQGIPDYSEEISKLNYNNSFYFLNFLIENTACKKIIVPGSCWEYNDGNVLGACSEDMKINPQKPFSIYKKKLYDQLFSLTEKYKIVLHWPRLFYVYGPHQKKTSIIPVLIDSFLNNKEVNIKCPKNRNDFIFIDDVVKILIFMLQSSIPSGIYNVGTGVTTEVAGLFDIINKFFLKKNSFFYKKIKEKKDSSQINFFADTIKLKKYFKDLDFENINSGLYKTCKYYSQKKSNTKKNLNLIN